ncbi:AMP-binding protein [Nocardia arthritidis]|uniref:AMP-binding protein n=1 Tax=Nocardia arthritidis TaxID=228602 RepID=A0A6G9YMB7_9NOCA|nr:AMP-binding protein [Nocardia arthritidis]QIS14176.1 AMP-binding protein [Nocardia arthritidis]
MSLTITDKTSFVDVIRHHAENTPEQRSLTFVSGASEFDVHWTYGQLDRRARAIASALQDQCLPGDRVLLLYPPSLEYVAAFLGCQYAGVTAVPAYPPEVGRSPRSLSRLLGIVEDAQISLVLTTSEAHAVADTLLPRGNRSQLRWCATDIVPDSAAADWRPLRSTSDDLAFLQYTSGSTRAPRGVRVTQRNLVANSELIRHAMRHDRNCHVVTWLPPYHDMGLIGGILQPLHLGMTCELMSPLTFLHFPSIWLERISGRMRVSAGGPNFAYDLCVRKIEPHDRERLDLSGWDVAFCGAEPVRAQTLRSFAAAFAVAGFRSRSLFPCYGMAECTLMVSGGQRPDGPSEIRVDADVLEQGRISLREGAGTRVLVGNGPVVPDHDVRVVNPHTGRPCRSDEVGEIWVGGPCVADGYWAEPEHGPQTFGAILPHRPEMRFLRTGDLGFLRDGELFVTGRRSELIIIDGRNFYPHDIEQTVAACHPALRPGGTAAFTVDRDDRPELVVLQELRRAHEVADPDDVLAVIRSAVGAEHGVMPAVVALVEPGAVPKTSSGKVQRMLCRADFGHGRLAVVAQWRLADQPTRLRTPPRGPAWQRHDELVRYLTDRINTVLRLEHGSVLGAKTGFLELGIDSVAAVEIRNRVQAELGVPLPVGLLFDHPTIDALAGYLHGVLALSERTPR